MLFDFFDVKKLQNYNMGGGHSNRILIFKNVCFEIIGAEDSLDPYAGTSYEFWKHLYK